MKIHPDVDAFYTKYIRNEYFKTKKPESSPIFIDLKDCPVTYEHFRSSFKAHGHVADDAMAAHVKLFNMEANEAVTSSSNCKKYTFSPFLVSKLIKDPASFDKRSCVREVKRINSKVKLAGVDLMNCPFVNNGHWVLACVNCLFSITNFFDSAGLTSEKNEEELIHNLVTNLTTVFNEFKIECKDFTQFKKFNPPNCPRQSKLHDSGFNLMLYLENWNGKFMKDFTNVIILEYKMLKAHKMFYSIHNRVDTVKLEGRKKKM